MMQRDFPLQQRVRHCNESLRSTLVEKAQSMLRDQANCGLDVTGGELTLL